MLAAAVAHSFALPNYLTLAWMQITVVVAESYLYG
jgi:hypothetical protein